MKPELRECPFCGCELILMGDDWGDVPAEKRYYRHPDNDCEQFSGYEFDAPIGWNRRSQPSAEEVREACARVCEGLAEKAWDAYKKGDTNERGNSYFEGCADEADACGRAIRSLDLSALGKETSK